MFLFLKKKKLYNQTSRFVRFRDSLFIIFFADLNSSGVGSYLTIKIIK